MPEQTAAPLDVLVETLVATYGQLTAVVAGLAAADLARPTRTDWTVAELLYHQSLDAVRALAALATTTDAEPDVDAVTYWRPFRPGVDDDGAASHARFVRIAAGAFADPADLVAWWRTMSGAAGRAAAAADPSAAVRTQGHVLGVPDLVSTLLVEATVHHLDLTADLAGTPAPTPAGLAEARRVLVGLLGAPLPQSWDDAEAVLKGTGRTPLTTVDRRLLGDRADRIPLLG